MAQQTGNATGNTDGRTTDPGEERTKEALQDESLPLIQSDNTGKAFYQTGAEYEKDKGNPPGDDDKLEAFNPADTDQ